MINNIFGQPKKQLTDLRPCVAGQFYPAEPTELNNMLKGFFSAAKPSGKDGEVLAIISPHAGYVFSGKVAASAFNQLDPGKDYETVFIIGSSHQMYFEGAAIYNLGNLITPLGNVRVNLSLADKIIKENPVFTSKPEAFRNEHSLEVQLPFLQYHLKKDFEIIPVLLGTHNAEVSKSIAEALKPYLNSRNLFVFSADFSHYPDYRNASVIDKQTADAILTKSPVTFINTINTGSDQNIPNLSTRLCAWPSILALLYMIEKNNEIEVRHIDYMNSGDSRYGDKIRVVGYNAMSIVSRKEKAEKTVDFILSESDKDALLLIARSSIENYLSKNKGHNINPDQLNRILKTNSGAFVTLHKQNKLRGCIGRLSTDTPLYKVVQEMAIAAAVNDYRFDKVMLGEMKEIDIEISVLTPLKKINSIDEIEMGRHGIYIKKDYHTGTFLPQVAQQTNWSREEFISHCARDKAMIGWDGWKDKDTEIYTYEAVVFSEKELHK